MAGVGTLMPDSPKCKDDDAQTYRIAGTQTFKCQMCKKIFGKAEFEAIAFTWKDSPKAYKEWDNIRKSEKVKAGSVKLKSHENGVSVL
jgi:phage FluMu protein Com